MVHHARCVRWLDGLGNARRGVHVAWTSVHVNEIAALEGVVLLDPDVVGRRLGEVPDEAIVVEVVVIVQLKSRGLCNVAATGELHGLVVGEEIAVLVEYLIEYEAVNVFARPKRDSMGQTTDAGETVVTVVDDSVQGEGYPIGVPLHEREATERARVRQRECRSVWTQPGGEKN